MRHFRDFTGPLDPRATITADLLDKLDADLDRNGGTLNPNIALSHLVAAVVRLELAMIGGLDSQRVSDGRA